VHDEVGRTASHAHRHGAVRLRQVHLGTGDAGDEIHAAELPAPQVDQQVLGPAGEAQLPANRAVQPDLHDRRARAAGALDDDPDRVGAGRDRRDLRPGDRRRTWTFLRATRRAGGASASPAGTPA
jgi:hypothetical protein